MNQLLQIGILLTLTSWNNSNELVMRITPTSVIEKKLDKIKIVETNQIDSVQLEIENIFKNINKQEAIINHKKYCNFEYKTGDSPDVDVFDSEYQLILANIDNKCVAKLINQYGLFCKECKDNSIQFDLLKKENTFLVKGIYSIQLNYKIVDRKITDIICLIYSKDRYILFSLGSRLE